MRYNTESSVCALEMSLGNRMRRLLCAEASGAVGVCDVCWFGVLLGAEYNRLVELIERIHDLLFQ